MTRQANKYEKLKVKTPTGTQEILFTHKFPINFLKQYDKIILVVDSRASNNQKVKEHIQDIEVAFPNKNYRIITQDINSHIKNTHLMMALLDIMEQLGMTRRSLMVGIGGGSIGDLVGVTASLYMRGIDYCLVPTTYISMVDGVVSKVAINHGHSKNLVGVFISPKLTVVDTLIADVNDHKIISYGLVEMWKHALLVNDKTIIQEIFRALDSNHQYSYEELQKWVYWSMKIKIKFISEDWHDEKNIHRALSLGHTLANIYEMRCNIHHAEAVTYGILFEAIVSNKAKVLSDKRLESILSIASKLEAYFNNFNQSQNELTTAMILKALKKDKINSHGVFQLVLPTDDGYCIREIDNQLLSDSLVDYLSLRFNKELDIFKSDVFIPEH